MVATCQSKGRCTLKIFHLFFSKWNHNSQNQRHALIKMTLLRHNLTRKLFMDVINEVKSIVMFS